MADANGNGRRVLPILLTALATLSVSLIVTLVVGYQDFARADDVSELEDRVRAVEAEVSSSSERIVELQKIVQRLVTEVDALNSKLK